MTERQLQFRVGLFVVLAMSVGAVLIIQFSELKELWRETYPLAIHFSEVPGLHPGCPVKQNGIGIGRVKDILLDDDSGGVLVLVEIHGSHRLRKDAQPHISRSLFGDSKIEFSAGKSDEIIPPQARLEGLPPTDPMQAIERLERTVNVTLASFEATGREWQLVAKNINGLVETNRGNLGEVIERTAVALDNFNLTMQAATTTFAEAGRTLQVASGTLANANDLISDPQLQANLRQTAASLPQIAEEARITIAAARASMQQVSRNLETIQQATLPIAQESDVIARKLSGSLIQLESLLGELNRFSQVLNAKDGSLQKLAADPALYQNLTRSAATLSVLLTNLQPIVQDVQVFTDRIARHPELLGVSGAVRGSSGLKEASEVQPAGYSAPANSR